MARCNPAGARCASAWTGLRLLAAALIALVSPAALWAEAESFTRETALATFDAAWQLVYDTHFDRNFNGVDWLALRDELRPRAEAAVTNDGVRAVIREMLGRLGQSHFALFPREVADAGDPSELGGDGDAGMELRLVGDEVVVFRVRPWGPAAQARVQPGWVVTAVGDWSVADLLALLPADTLPQRRALIAIRSVGARLQGPFGSTVEVGFLDAWDEPVRLTLTREREPGETVKVGLLPPFVVRLESEAERGPDGTVAGLIRFNTWMTAVSRAFDEAIDRYRNADGIIIDLRGNPGGLGAMVMGIAGHFFSERVTLGTMTMRDTRLNIVALPRRISPAGEWVQPYAGPVAVLIDDASGSASEMFSGGMQSVGRVRVFGQTSIGGVLPASFHRLPNGDALYHAIGDFQTAQGMLLEGRGVVPDEPVPLTRADLLAGRDAVLEAALRWIASQRADVPRGQHFARAVSPFHYYGRHL